MSDDRIVQFEKLIDAIRHADADGIALHVWDAAPGAFPDAPECFKHSSRWGHLMCKDRQKLLSLAYQLGVKCIKVGRDGRSGQHIDLCGQPLQRAIERAERNA